MTNYTSQFHLWFIWLFQIHSAGDYVVRRRCSKLSLIITFRQMRRCLKLKMETKDAHPVIRSFILFDIFFYFLFLSDDWLRKNWRGILGIHATRFESFTSASSDWPRYFFDTRLLNQAFTEFSSVWRFATVVEALLSAPQGSPHQKVVFWRVWKVVVLLPESRQIWVGRP